MRSLFWLLLAHALQPAPVDWARVDINIHKLDPSLATAALPAADMQHIRKVILRALGDQDWPGCGAPEDRFQIFKTPIAPDVLQVVPGPGNCRGGQGSNGALWLVRRTGTGWQVLASPAGGFNGWGLGLQPHRNHGLPDLVLGWHMGAADFVLTYFRYDGHSYRSISSVEFQPCSPATERFCLKDGTPARNTSPQE